MWKRYEFNGGTSDPCILAWPSVLGHGGEIRHQYHHAIDIVPTGELSLYNGDRKVGEARIKNQPGYFELAGEGLCIGRDSGAAVTEDYPGQQPFRFTGGTIKRVVVDVSGQPYVDLEREAAAMLARE